MTVANWGECGGPPSLHRLATCEQGFSVANVTSLAPNDHGLAEAHDWAECSRAGTPDLCVHATSSEAEIARKASAWPCLGWFGWLVSNTAEYDPAWPSELAVPD